MASIRKRGEHSYQITVSRGYDSSGKRITPATRTVTLDKGLKPKQIEKELNRLAVEFESEVERGTYLDGAKLTFSEFIEIWLRDYATKELQPKTLHRYKSILERIEPALGHIKLQKLQPTHLIEFYSNLRENGIRNDGLYFIKPELSKIMKAKKLTKKALAEKANISVRTLQGIFSGKRIKPKTVQAISKALEEKIDTLFEPATEVEILADRTILHHHRLMSCILRTAVEWQFLFSNPADRVKAPRVEKTEAAHYDEGLTEKVLDLLENEPIKYRTMVSLAIYSGARRGELCGLEWSDVDFTNNRLRIRQSSQYIPGQGTFTKQPKNESSVRSITLPNVAIDTLKEYKAWQNEQRLQCGDLWQDNDRLFTQWDGKPIHPDTVSGWFMKFRKKHNLPDLMFHGLRHTNATILIAQNVDVQTISKRLGHARPSTTTDIYSHALRRPDMEAAEKLDNLFNKKNKTGATKKA